MLSARTSETNDRRTLSNAIMVLWNMNFHWSLAAFPMVIQLCAWNTRSINYESWLTSFVFIGQWLFPYYYYDYFQQQIKRNRTRWRLKWIQSQSRLEIQKNLFDKWITSTAYDSIYHWPVLINPHWPRARALHPNHFTTHTVIVCLEKYDSTVWTKFRVAVIYENWNVLFNIDVNID